MKRVVFLPGAGGSAEFWRPLAALLPSHWSKTLLAWPGLGNQSHDPNVQGFDDLVRLAEQQLADEPVDLVAQSMGGAVALAVTARHPQRIRRLVLAATSGGIDLSGFGCEDWRPAYRSEFPEAANWISETRPDFTAALPKISQPALLLWGADDRISPVAVGERLQTLLPNAKLSVIAGGDHGFAHDRVAEIAPKVIEHLSR
jgi:pimeloyl-ACP methyl ester carboxylesterase